MHFNLYNVLSAKSNFVLLFFDFKALYFLQRVFQENVKIKTQSSKCIGCYLVTRGNISHKGTDTSASNHGSKYLFVLCFTNIS